MKNLTIILIVLVFMGCMKDPIQPTQQEKGNTVKSIVVYFVEKDITITFEELIITEQFITWDIYGETNEGVYRIEDCKTYNDALQLLDQITTDGYYESYL